MDLKRLFFVVVFRGKGEGGGKGGEVKPFRGLGACSTEIRTSEIAKMCASKLLWYTTFLFRKSYTSQY